MKKTKTKIALLLIIIISLAFSKPNNYQWQILGQRTVDMRADHDEVMITAWNGTFTKLKFKVLKAPIYIKNIRIVYGNGSVTKINVNKSFRQGAESKAFDLPGNHRIVQKVILNYSTIPTYKGKAKILILGKH